MSRLAVLALLTWLLLVGGLGSLDRHLVAYVLPLIAYLTVAVLRRPSPDALNGEARLAKPSASAGQRIEVSGGLRSRLAPIEELQFADLVPDGLKRVAGQSEGLGYLAGGQSLGFDYQVQTERGLHHFPGIRVELSDPFNLFRSERLLAAERTLLVRPSTSTIRRVSVRPIRAGVIAGPYPARSGGPGVEFFGVRRYTPGDPIRWINWKASARGLRRLYINLFEQERIIDMGLIVDARLRSNTFAGGGSVFPHSVGAAASLAEHFLAQGNRVGLLIYGSHLDWTVPGYGRVQRERIMRRLARASEGDSRIFEQIDHLPTRLFAAKTQLILISPLLNGDLDTLIRLRARRYPLLVISPDRDRMEAPALDGSPELPLAARIARLEQRLITRSLANAGVPRLVWDLDIPLEQLLEMRLSRPQAWLRSVGVAG